MVERDPARLPPMPQPKFQTKRDPSLYSVGPFQAKFAETWYGRPLLRWQRLVLDVSGERLPSGRPRYPHVLVTVQRQAGKTDVMLVSAGERCMSRPDFMHGHTAQTGQDAQKEFLKYDKRVIQRSPLKNLVHVRRGNGSCDMTFPNGSMIAPKPPGEKTGHGDQFDLYDIDEAWAFDKEQGSAIMQAIGPTQLTRPDPQIRMWSAGGTAASTWLAALVARGRGGDPNLCYFEWGIPDDLSLDDDEEIASYHPAYGEMITADSIAKLRVDLEDADDPGKFARGAGNRWTEIIGGAISLSDWNSLRWISPLPDDAPIGFGAARATDGSHTVLAAAGMMPDGLIVVEIIKVVPVTEGAETVKAYAAGEALAVDPSGPSAALADELRRLKVPMIDFTARDVGAACTNVLDAIRPRSIRYRVHPALDAAVKVAGTRTVGDGGKAWARVAAGAPIAAIEAASNAIWALNHRPRKIAKPRIYLGKDAA